MRMNLVFTGLGLTTALLFNGVAQAQDWQLPPTYGETTLNGGFMPDPATTTVQAGGSIDISLAGLMDTASGMVCGQSFVAQAPDYRVQYTAGASLLRFYAVTPDGGDVTLLVNGPDGSWFCNDDSFGTLMPTIDFYAPVAGQYDIWVGTYEPGTTSAATLYVTELESNSPSGSTAPPGYGTIEAPALTSAPMNSAAIQLQSAIAAGSYEQLWSLVDPVGGLSYCDGEWDASREVALPMGASLPPEVRLWLDNARANLASGGVNSWVVGEGYVLSAGYDETSTRFSFVPTPGGPRLQMIQRVNNLE